MTLAVAGRERHLAGVYVSSEYIAHILSCDKDKGVWLPSNSLPDDVRVASVNFDPSRQAFLVVFEHPSFYLTYEGDPVVLIDLEMHLYDIAT